MTAEKVLQYTVIRENPETLQAVPLLAGTAKSDLPDWAKELVHDDDFGSAEEGDGGSSDGDPADYASMTPEELTKLADDRDVEVIGTGSNGNVKKGDLVAALTAADDA